jgi:tetratricopeptide (TPR) repeat protein
MLRYVSSRAALLTLVAQLVLPRPLVAAYGMLTKSGDRTLTTTGSIAVTTSTAPTTSRRALFSTVAAASFATAATWSALSPAARAETTAIEGAVTEVLIQATGDAKKLFNEGRAYESQGNLAAAQRVYGKVTQILPRFVYGWSGLGNTQTALGDLNAAETSYSTAIELCQESLSQDDGLGGRRCGDLYILLLNRGSLRLNNGMVRESLNDLTQSNTLRGRPDAMVLQNLARAEELNGFFQGADRDYSVAIGMSGNEVNPFWLRAALVKYQLGDIKGSFDIFQRVQNRFPEAPEVRAAYGVLLAAKGEQIAGQRKFLEIPDRQRLKYSDGRYLKETIAWPPAMVEGMAKLSQAVGDSVR